MIFISSNIYIKKNNHYKMEIRMRKIFLISLLILVLLLSSCSKEENKINKFCGDGICDNFELKNPNLCPKDCKVKEHSVVDAAEESLESEKVFEEEQVECDSPLEAQNYLIAFNSCSHEDCDSPKNHEIFLAGSDDGEEWELIEEFDNGHMGSVPDIVYYNDYIYLFHTSSGGDHNYDVLDKCFNIIETGTASLEGGDEDGWVDPSLIVDGDELVLFYLPGVKGQDPAMCPEEVESCTKEIHSARSSLSTFPLFQLVSETRVEAELNTNPDSGAIRSFSDPDIIQLEDDSYLLYVSSGSNSLVYVGSDLDGSFESPSDDIVFASERQGGVPSVIQDLSTGDVWLYVHKDNDGNRVIKRAVSDGITELSSSDFKTVIDDGIFVDSDNHKSFSPSIIRWPDDWR